VRHIGALKAKDPDLRVQIGIFDFLDCLTELRADRLDIAIVGIAGDETIPQDLEAVLLYHETSSLYCTPDHSCCGLSDPTLLKQALAEADISAHSFVFNPIDEDLDPKLLDQSKGVAQDTIELTAYLALSGTHVGLMPDHYANHWVASGQLVRIPSPDYTIVSQFHALRLRAPHRDAAARMAWHMLNAKDAPL